MKQEQWSRVRAVFEELLELPVAERNDRVAGLCGDDADLLREVARLLDAHEAADDWLEPPCSEDLAWEEPPPLDLGDFGEGTRIGAYLVQRIVAHGGMGTVYEALQENPRRTVALKMMRSGMSSPGARRRFDYESEVLARLHHPGIAQIYEAGTHELPSGPVLPYFAMEFVESARTLVRFADEDGLDIDRRVELFARVCDAVQHGHQRGVVHRDLKPSNILVDLSGGPKVIDFGVARATDTERSTLATRTGEIVGTLRYMSPEQVRGDLAEVDTRSDVYALGVVLYELLTGRPPHAVDDLGLPAAARAIEEVDPPRPSTVDAAVPRELDWVILRALEKHPDRRYHSAAALAADLRRFLAHEPLAAGPPSTTYRVRKFVARHRVGVVMAAAVLVALVGGIIGTTRGMFLAQEREREASDARGETAKALAVAEEQRGEAQREAALSKTVSGLLENLLGAGDSGVHGRDVRVSALIGPFADSIEPLFAEHPEIAARLHGVAARTFFSLGDHEGAERHLDVALALAEDGYVSEAETVLHLALRARVLQRQGDFDLAEELADEALARAEGVGFAYVHQALASVLEGAGYYDEAAAEARLAIAAFAEAEDIRGEAYACMDLGRVLLSLMRPADAEPELRAALAIAVDLVPRDPGLVLELQSHLASALDMQGRHGEALPLLHDVLAGQEEWLGPLHPGTNMTRGVLALLLSQGGSLEQARELQEEVVRTLRTSIDDPKGLAVSLVNLAVTLARLGRGEESLARMEEAHTVAREELGPDHPTTLGVAGNYGSLLIQLGEIEKSEVVLREAWEGRRRASGDSDVMTLRARTALAAALLHLERLEEAEEHFVPALAGLEAALPPEHPLVVEAREGLAILRRHRASTGR